MLLILYMMMLKYFQVKLLPVNRFLQMFKKIRPRKQIYQIINSLIFLNSDKII